jgi:hypothetical protein
VGVPGLPLVAQLRHRPLLALGDEDRVEAEALGAARLDDDPPLEDAGAAALLALRRERHELADVPGPPVLDAPKLGKEPVDVEAAGEAGGPDPRRAVEAGDLEARVLAEDPRARLDRAAVLGLRLRVVVVGVPRLGRVVVGLERLDPPVRERRPELAELAGVLRREPGV